MAKTNLTVKVKLNNENAYINGYLDDNIYRLRTDRNNKPYIRLLGIPVHVTKPIQESKVDNHTFTLKVQGSFEQFA